jgi:mycobactin peptide synthetase MbtF
MAYVAAEPAPDMSELRAMLSKRLPRYMVPQSIVIVDQMPLTSHGKIDEAALAAISVDDGPSAAPETETEAALVAVLTELLDGVEVDVTAEFLSLGLDSIVALSVVQGARQRGIPLRARLMIECATIRELAEAIDSEAITGPAALTDDRYGDVVPAPIMSWMFEHGNFRRFTQNMLIALPEGLTAERVEAILQVLLDRHDMLRSVLGTDGGEGYRLTTRAPGAVRAGDVMTVVYTAAQDALAEEATAAVDRIDPTTGSMVQAVWFAAEPSLLLMCVHHLATDVVSWYVMLSELSQLAADIEAGRTPGQAAEFTTYREWTRLLAERSRSEEVVEQRAYWTDQVAAPDPALGRRLPDPTRDTWGSTRLTDVVTDAATTRAVLRKLGDSGIEMRDFLLAALTLTLASWRISRGEPAHHGALIALEGHGREDGVVATDPGAVESAAVPLDTSATVGWFTSVYPVRLGKGAAIDVDTAARAPDAARTLLLDVTQQLAAVPNRGLDYGLLRYLCGDETLAGFAGPQVEFNYLGRHDLSADQGRSEWSLVTDPDLSGQLPVPEPDLPLRYTFDVSAIVVGGKGGTDGPMLLASWRWSDQLSDAADVDRLSQLWLRAITALGEAL